MNKLLRSKLVIIIGLLVFLAGSGALVWFLVLSPGVHAAKPPEKPIEGKSVLLDPFRTNLADAGARRFIQLEVELYVADEQAVKEVTKMASQVRSEILTLLRSRFIADLDGQLGMNRLAADMVERVNGILSRPSVLNVFFTDFIIQ